MSDPITREETYLAAIAGDDVNLPNPITREEMYLAAAAGMAVELPNPITRKEQFLQRVVETGGTGGGGVTIRNQNKTITQNGQYKADSGYTGLGTVTVNVPQEEPVVEPLKVTENGTYNPPAGVDGYGPVTVNVEASGGGGADVARAIVNRTITEYNDSEITEIGEYAFYKCANLKSFNLPKLEKLGGYGFKMCTSLKSFDSNVPVVNMAAFDGCTALETVNLPYANATETGVGSIFYGCKNLKEVNIPSMKWIWGGVFNGCSSLPKLVLNSCTRIGGGAFTNATVLKVLVLPKADTPVTLDNVNALTGTPFASGGTGGTVYCPAALITQYQQATNWATLYAAGTCNFVAIEGSEYE